MHGVAGAGLAALESGGEKGRERQVSRWGGREMRGVLNPVTLAAQRGS